MKKVYLFFRIFFTMILAFLFLPKFSNAQNGFILYGFRDVQQSSFLNPAFTSGATTVIGIPFLSNFSTGLVSSAGGLNNFFARKSGSDSLYLDLSKVINNNRPVDKITEFLDMDILFAGFKVGSTFISLGVRQRVFAQAILDRDLLKLVWNGDSQYANQTLAMNNTAVTEYHLLDYHLGISVPIGDKFRVGARFHILQGLSDINTKNNGISLKTLQNSNGDFEIHARTSFLVNTSGLPDSSNFNLRNYLLNFNNLGFAVDLGVDVQVTKRIWINASVLDWGKVYYRSNTKTYSPANENVNFNSAKIDFHNGSIADTLQKLFDIKEEAQNYSIKLPGRIIVGGEYYTKDMCNDFSLLFSGRFFKDYFEPAVSVAYTRFVSGHFSFKANYTWIKDAPMNFGAALAVNFFPFQFYLYSDNVAGLFQWDRQKHVQAGFGLNIRLAPRNTRKSPHNPENIHNLRPDIIN
jgi:hypothetical protein